MRTETIPYVSQVAILKAQRVKKIKQIEELRKALDEEMNELVLLENEILLNLNNEVEQVYAAKGLKLTKKDLIIEYFNRDIPQDKIAEFVGVSSNYVSRILGQYRKEVGIDLITKGQGTKQRIIQCLSSGMSINKTAIVVGKTPQYVCAIKREYKNRLIG